MKKINPADLPVQTEVKINTKPRIYRCERLWHWNALPLKDFDFWTVLDGEGTLEVGRKKHSLRPGISFILKPGEQPIGHHNPDKRLVVFAVHFDFLKNGKPLQGREIEWLPHPLRIRDMTSLQGNARQLIQQFESKAIYGAQRCQFIFWQLFFQAIDETLYAPSFSHDERIEKVVYALEEDPGKEWSVEIMAKEAGLSRTHFTRMFIQRTGNSPTRYLIQVRIARACQLMEESNLTVSQIADELGYKDLYFFSRQFKQEKGVSPRIFRKEKKMK